MLGNGDGTFASPTVAIAQIPGAVTMAGISDFNDDHIPDLAFFSSPGLTVFLGHGDGTFGSASTVFAGASPNSLVIADFNNDGFADVAVGSSAGLGVLLGKGDGTFQPAAFSNPGSMTLGTAADLRGIGKVDLIINPGNVEVLLGNGDGTFQPPGPSLPPQVGERFISAVDMDGDGKLDLVMWVPSEVFLGNGDGTFGIVPIGILGAGGGNGGSTIFDPGANFLLVADFNGDGRLDVVLDVGAPESPGVATLLNVAAPATPGFLIADSALSPAMVGPGTSARSTITVMPANGFSGNVALTCSGLPSGASCSFLPASLPNGSGTSALTVTTSASTPQGTYFVSVIGASTALTHERLLTFTVVSTDFSMAVSTATATVTAGQTATYTISFASSGGFNGTIALSCSGAPANSTCIVSPTSVLLNGTSTPPATVTLTTKAASEMSPLVGPNTSRRINDLLVPLVSLLAMLLIASLCATRRAQRFGWTSATAIALLLCLGMALTSCGSGSSGGGGGGTQAGTYTITVSGSAASGSTTLTHSTKLTLIVQ